MRIMISGGGTGGHVFPAIAIADAIKRKQSDAEFLFVGALGKIEMEKVPQAGYTIVGLDIKGMKRSLSLDTLVTIFKAGKSLLKAFRLVRTFKPDVAIGVGGYASGPVLKVASLLGVPTMIQEQNSYAGVTNKLLAQKAEKIFVAYPGMDRFFDKSKIVVSGNPLRSSIGTTGLTKSEAMKTLGLPEDARLILIMGGSLGARTINEAITKGQDLVSTQEKTYLYWQVGKLYIEEFRQKSIAKLENVVMKDFIENMAVAYAAADIIVARAGALTISELGLVGKPAILVPSPNVAEDHQTHNAMSLVDAGAALLVKDKEAAEKLVTTMFELVNDHQACDQLAANMQKLGKPHAADDIADHILKSIAHAS